MGHELKLCSYKQYLLLFGKLLQIFKQIEENLVRACEMKSCLPLFAFFPEPQRGFKKASNCLFWLKSRLIKFYLDTAGHVQKQLDEHGTKVYMVGKNSYFSYN